jgi:hypothetical protein
LIPNSLAPQDEDDPKEAAPDMKLVPNSSVVEKVLQAREPDEGELLELWHETLDRESQDWLQTGGASSELKERNGMLRDDRESHHLF